MNATASIAQSQRSSNPSNPAQSGAPAAADSTDRDGGLDFAGALSAAGGRPARKPAAKPQDPPATSGSALPVAGNQPPPGGSATATAMTTGSAPSDRNPGAPITTAMAQESAAAMSPAKATRPVEPNPAPLPAGAIGTAGFTLPAATAAAPAATVPAPAATMPAPAATVTTSAATVTTSPTTVTTSPTTVTTSAAKQLAAPAGAPPGASAASTRVAATAPGQPGNATQNAPAQAIVPGAAQSDATAQAVMAAALAQNASAPPPDSSAVSNETATPDNGVMLAGVAAANDFQPPMPAAPAVHAAANTSASVTAATAASIVQAASASADSGPTDKHSRGNSPDGTAGAAQLLTSNAASDAAPGPAPSFKVSAGVDTADFGQGVADRVSLMMDGNLTSAKLQVNPPALGPIEVRIALQGGHAQVWMSSHSAVTRDALESSSPKLREMLGAQGFAQVSVDISQRSFQDRSPQPQAYENMPAIGSDSPVPVQSSASAARSASGLLDAYA